MRKTTSILIAFLLLMGIVFAPAGYVFAEEVQEPEYVYDIMSINASGNVVLSEYGNTFADNGFEYGDIIEVRIGNETYQMPVGSSYTDVDAGEMMCRVKLDEDIEKSAVIFAVNGGSFAEETGLAEKETIEEDPGYEWHYAEALGDTPEIAVTMYEKGGYAEQYELRSLKYTNEREDYPDLADEDYANFRMIATTGIAPYILYRSSTPIDPVINRCIEADEALNNAVVKTIINMCNTEAEMEDCENYYNSYYSQRTILAQLLPTNFESAEFEAGIAEAIRFMAANDGPYLIHCKEGKDRTGFLCSILECLMGASFEEVTEDYLKSYYNYYGDQINEDKAEFLRQYFSNILSVALGIEDLTDETDLAADAERYLLGIGVQQDEIDILKDKLARGLD